MDYAKIKEVIPSCNITHPKRESILLATINVYSTEEDQEDNLNRMECLKLYVEEHIQDDEYLQSILKPPIIVLDGDYSYLEYQTINKNLESKYTKDATKLQLFDSTFDLTLEL